MRKSSRRRLVYSSSWSRMELALNSDEDWQIQERRSQLMGNKVRLGAPNPSFDLLVWHEQGKIKKAQLDPML